MCRDVRKDAIGLVDSFNLPDFVMNSPFGRYDGDVYTHYFAQVRARNPPTHPVDYFDSHIKPLLHRKIEEQTEPDDEEETQ
jgi:acyl-CoA oxidase